MRCGVRGVDEERGLTIAFTDVSFYMVVDGSVVELLGYTLCQIGERLVCFHVRELGSKNEPAPCIVP